MIYKKNYKEMSVGMGQPGQPLFTATERYVELDMDEQL